MNRKFRTIAVAVLLLGVASLVGGCKKSLAPFGLSGKNLVNTSCVQFADLWKSAGPGFEHKMQVKLLCVSDADTNRLELDGTCIKEFYGHDEIEVTRTVANGNHRILCYTVGTTDTVVNITFEQENNSINWTSHIY